MNQVLENEIKDTSDYQMFEDKRWTGRLQKVVFRHEAALDLLRKSNTLSFLDVGCGDGVFESFVLAQDPTLIATGIDLSHVAIASAQAKVPHASFQTADVLTDGIPHENDSFDTVVALDVLEHTFMPAQLLNEMKRVSKRYVIVGVPNFSSLPSRVQMVFGKVPENNRPKKGHVYWFNNKVLTKLLRDNGMSVIAMKTNCQAEYVPILGSIMRILTRISPGLFALSFVVLAEKSK